jgi:putative aldouronate transport system permease protein
MFFFFVLIPFYLAVRGLGLVNTPLALIFPVAINTYNLIVMRTSFMAVPDSLQESARIDGANEWVILFRIVLGVSKPVIAVMILFYGVYHWNAWFNAMIFIRRRELFPLQLILREILINNSTELLMTSGIDMADKEMIGETIKYATIMCAILPILFAYPFLQRYFEKGVMIGALKE